MFRMEKCFTVNQIPEEEKLGMVLACMTGCAVTWLRNAQDREDLSNWKDFKDKLKKRFRPTRGGTIIWQMFKLRQTGNVEGYNELFEELSAEVPHVTSDVLDALFLNGMKKSLHDQVVRYRPIGMDDIVDTTKMIEEQESDKGSYSSKPFIRTTSAPNLNYNNRGAGQSPRSGNDFTPARISFDNARDYKGSGSNSRAVHNPCRQCGERYFVGHRCKSHQRYKCMELEEGFDDGDMAERTDEEEQVEPEEPIREVGMHKLSLQTMSRFANDKSMRMMGHINGVEIGIDRLWGYKFYFT